MIAAAPTPTKQLSPSRTARQARPSLVFQHVLHHDDHYHRRRRRHRRVVAIPVQHPQTSGLKARSLMHPGFSPISTFQELQGTYQELRGTNQWARGWARRRSKDRGTKKKTKKDWATGTEGKRRGPTKKEKKKKEPGVMQEKLPPLRSLPAEPNLPFTRRKLTPSFNKKEVSSV
mmetsp:Transcript_81533/g.170533  ORF Transcript_81533/g.170533 Transcript_81533/m.170533 type:complete len:174 (+) Transcript_81533:278-799(+)